MNGYNLLRAWYNFKFDNPHKAKAKHSDFYCYLVDQWNRLGQKECFGLPTTHTMECLGIGSYNTYKQTLDDLIEFGFLKIIKDSRNQHHSKIIALSNIDKATDKPLDKATAKARDEAPDTITKQRTKNKEKTPKSPKGDIPFKYDVYLEKINEMFNRNHRVVSDRLKSKIQARLKQGYTAQNFWNAIINVKNNDFHIENNYQHVDPYFFTQESKLSKYGDKIRDDKKQIGGHTEYHLID